MHTKYTMPLSLVQENKLNEIISLVNQLGPGTLTLWLDYLYAQFTEYPLDNKLFMLRQAQRYFISFIVAHSQKRYAAYHNHRYYEPKLD